MKNTIKMSLVAALAVAGLSQTASAGSLEEAIKGVSISGKMEVEYDYNDTAVTGTTADNTTNAWDYDFDVTAKVPVNDMVTAVMGFQADDGENVESGANADASVTMTKYYFQYANGPVTAMIGKQGMAGAPWFDDERGNGVVALYNAGVATLAAAHFTSVPGAVAGEPDVTAVAAIGKVGPVNASLWYANLSGISQNTTSQTAALEADSYSINVNGSFDIVNLDVTYTDVDYDYGTGATTTEDADLLKIIASVDAGVATIYGGYGETGKNASSTAGVDLTTDNDAATNMKMEIYSIDQLDDAETFLIGATATVDAWKFDLSHLTGDYTSGSTSGLDVEETLLDIEYKMSKNLTLDMFYATAELDTSTTSTTDRDAASIALEYKF
jgi:hypothetical protein